MTAGEIRARLAAFPEAELTGGDAPLTVKVPVARWAELGVFVKDTIGCRFFSFLTAIDWKDDGLDVIAWVDHVEAGVSLLLKTRVPPTEPVCPSLARVFRGADWMERECYDMFGIRFDGHPDLRRILLSDDWQGHPLRKSYAVDTPFPPYR